MPLLVQPGGDLVSQGVPGALPGGLGVAAPRLALLGLGCAHPGAHPRPGLAAPRAGGVGEGGLGQGQRGQGAETSVGPIGRWGLGRGNPRRGEAGVTPPHTHSRGSSHSGCVDTGWEDVGGTRPADDPRGRYWAGRWRACASCKICCHPRASVVSCVPESALCERGPLGQQGHHVYARRHADICPTAPPCPVCRERLRGPCTPGGPRTRGGSVTLGLSATEAHEGT